MTDDTFGSDDAVVDGGAFGANDPSLSRRSNPVTGWKDFANRIVRAISQGVTLGFGDELAAAGDATVAKVADYLGVSPETLKVSVREADAGKPWNQIYEQRLKNERQQLADFREEMPIAAYGGEITGAVMTGGGTGRLLANAMPRVPTLAAAPVIGAAEGAVAGFGQGQGVTDRIQNAGQSAAIGGLLAGSLSAGQAGLSAVTSRFSNPTARAQRQVIKDVLDDMKTPEGLVRRINRSDKPLMPVDVAGENTRDLADAVVTRGGRSAKAGARAVTNRQSRQPGRIIDDLDQVAPGGQYGQTVDELKDARSAAAQGGYTAPTMSQTLDSPDLKTLLESRPIYRKSFEQARDLMEEFGAALDDPFDGPITTQSVDEIQKILRDRAKVGGYEGSLATQARRELLSIVDDLNPEYAAARGRFASDSRLMEAAELGDRFKRMKPAEIASWVADKTDDEVAFFRQKVIERLRQDILSKKGAASDRVKVIVGTPYQRQQLEAVFGPEWKNVQRDLINEARISRTASDVSVNSRTARRQDKLAEIDGPDSGIPGYTAQFATEVARQPLTRTAAQAVSRFGQTVIDAVTGMRPNVQDEIASILFETDKTVAVRKLTELARRKEIDSRAAAVIRRAILQSSGAAGAGAAIGSQDREGSP